jgi:hypothetical protein
MKVVTIILITMLVLLVISQIWARSQVSGIEMYPYEVAKEYPDFEVRSYEKANFIYVTMDAETYKEGSSRGFNTLAGYIFGGNSTGQKIAMTSPVEMRMDEDVTMKFLVPAEYDLDEMPTPNNAAVKFMTEKERVLAAIMFSGFANDEKILEYKQRLFQRLAEEGIDHTGQWSFMGYDPPFKLIGRRNEVVVELK